MRCCSSSSCGAGLDDERRLDDSRAVRLPRPDDAAEALALLAAYGDEAKVLSGGQSLLPLLKLRVGAAGHLVDIGRIPGLDYIKEEGGFLKIGGRDAGVGARALRDRSGSRYPILPTRRR